MSEAIDEGFLSGPNHAETVIVGVADVGYALQKFGWPDYVVFVCMLLLCVVVGLYFGFFKTAKNAREYLVGGKNMQTIPVSLSLIASFVSGISLLGIPTEIYVYGIQYMYISGAIIIMGFMAEKIFLPVFHNLNVTSTYEYLERRFDKKIRVLGSVLFIIGLLTWLPIVIYVPALAFNQVTGINLHLITPLVCVICIFYTSAGGLKAVVWTDVIQTVIMFGSTILIVVKGTIDAGGFAAVWKRNWDSGRIEGPNFDPDPLSRHTVWALIIGGCFYWLEASILNQNMIQRYLALPDLKQVKRAVWLFVGGILILYSACCYCGMLIYATYYKCDPLTTLLAKEKDQLLPLLVMEVLGDYPGLPGLFVAGIFSAALSSLSTGLNSMAAVVWEDFYKMFFNKDLNEKQANRLLKITVVVIGVICVILVFIVEKLGTVLQLTMSVGAITNGPCLSLFTMGMLLPWINTKGAIIGCTSSLIVMSWICLRAQAAIATGDLRFPEKPVATDGCNYQFSPKQPSVVSIRYDPSVNITNITHTDERFMLYRLSYLWYTLLGVIVSVTVALIVSFITKPLDPRDVDSSLLAPFVNRLIKPREFPNQPTADGIIYAYDESAHRNGNAEDDDMLMKKVENPPLV